MNRKAFSFIGLIVLVAVAAPSWAQAAGFAYVANCGVPCDGAQPGTVSGYTIDGNGALTPMALSPFAAGAGSQSVAGHPNGNFLYVANLGSNNLSVFRITPASGLPVEISHA